MAEATEPPRIERTASNKPRLPETVGTRIVEARRSEDVRAIFDDGVGAVFHQDDKFGNDEDFANEYFFNTHRANFTGVLNHGLAGMSTRDRAGIDSQLQRNVGAAMNFWKDQCKRAGKPLTRAHERTLRAKIQAVADDLRDTLTRFPGFKIGLVSLEVEKHTKDEHTGVPGMHIDDGQSSSDLRTREIYGKRHLVVTRTYYGKSTVLDENGVERKTPNGSTVAFWGGLGGTLHGRPMLNIGERRFVAVIRLIPEE